VTLYLDASMLVAMIVEDPLNGRATAVLKAKAAPIVVSDIGALEFASAVALKQRRGLIKEADAERVYRLRHVAGAIGRDPD